MQGIYICTDFNPAEWIHKYLEAAKFNTLKMMYFGNLLSEGAQNVSVLQYFNEQCHVNSYYIYLTLFN